MAIVELIAWILLAVVAGVLTGWASAPRDWPAFAYVGVAVLAFALARALESAPPRRAWRRGLVLGGFYGFAVNALVLRFSVGLLIDFGRMPWPVALLVSVLLWSAQALVHAAAGCVVGAIAEHVGTRKRAACVYLALPAALVLSEHVVPMLFPWRLAAAVAPWTPMMQVAELGGEPLSTWLLAAFGCVFAAAGESHDRRRRIALGAICGALLAIPYGHGLVRVANVESARLRAPRLRVGLVQPNIAVGDKGNDDLAFELFDQLVESTRELERRGARLVVWPETAAPFAMRRTMRREPEGPWSLLDRGVRGPVLLGVVTWHSVTRKHNSAILLRPDGTYSRPADKLELIPFGEYTPFWEPIRDVTRALWPTAPFRPFIERARGFTPGDMPSLIESPARLGVLICYEDILPAVARRVFHATDGPPDLLVNMTNDAWFGDGDEPHMHLALSRFRAVETRRDLVRAVNTGVSAAITATGEVTQRTGTFRRATLLADVRLGAGTTPYMVLGDWVVSVAFALLAALGARALCARARR